MNKTDIKKYLMKLIAEAIEKNSWLTHQGEGFTISPLSLKNNIEDGKYLFPTGWRLVPEVTVIAKVENEVFAAKKNFDEFMMDVEANRDFAKTFKLEEEKPEAKIILLPGTKINEEEILKHTDNTSIN